MATAIGDEEYTNSASGDAEKESDNVCSPCHGDGKRLVAVGYCVNCKEYLCDECFKYHRVPTITRKHVLLDKEEMAKDVATHDNNNCPNHNNRTIEYHCKVHSFLGCHVCCFQEHKTCADVKHIEDVSKPFSESEEFKIFTSKLQLTAKRSRDLLAEVRRKIDNNENSHSEAITTFKDFKAKIIDAIDTLEKELFEKEETFRKEQTTKLNEVVSKITIVQEASQTLAAEIEVHQNKHQHSDLYIAVARSGDKLLSLENELVAMESDKYLDGLTFEGNACLADTLKSPWGLGRFVTKSTIDKVEFVADINVKSTEDAAYCYIMCSVLMPDNKLVATDYSNKNLKLITTKQHKLISTMKFSNSPQCVAKVTDDTVAVTIPNDKKIVFVRTDPSLSIDRELVVNGTCCGVAYKDGKLVVTYASPYKVELLDLKGTVLLSLDTDISGRQLFSYPYYVTINPDHDVMYVSNWLGMHNVVCLRLDGSVVATYQDSELKNPGQAVVNSTGMVYVCAYSSKTVTQMTPDCKKVKVLLTSSDGLGSLVSISYDESGNLLYIGEYNNNNVLKCTKFIAQHYRVDILPVNSSLPMSHI